MVRVGAHRSRRVHGGLACRGTDAGPHVDQPRARGLRGRHPVGWLDGRRTDRASVDPDRPPHVRVHSGYRRGVHGRGRGEQPLGGVPSTVRGFCAHQLVVPRGATVTASHYQPVAVVGDTATPPGRGAGRVVRRSSSRRGFARGLGRGVRPLRGVGRSWRGRDVRGEAGASAGGDRDEAGAGGGRPSRARYTFSRLRLPIGQVGLLSRGSGRWFCWAAIERSRLPQLHPGGRHRADASGPCGLQPSRYGLRSSGLGSGTSGTSSSRSQIGSSSSSRRSAKSRWATRP